VNAKRVVNQSFLFWYKWTPPRLRWLLVSKGDYNRSHAIIPTCHGGVAMFCIAMVRTCACAGNCSHHEAHVTSLGRSKKKLMCMPHAPYTKGLAISLAYPFLQLSPILLNSDPAGIRILGSCSSPCDAREPSFSAYCFDYLHDPDVLLLLEIVERRSREWKS
jgi:hypothetical protein